MKTKQLANVLIKILGLSLLIQNINNVILVLISVLQARRIGSPSPFWAYPLLVMVVPVIGICLMVKSREVAEFLFKNEEE
jgi:hypothetical protein